MKLQLAVAFAASINFFLPTACAGSVADDSNFVIVGSPGNPSSSESGCGAVSQEFRISKYEVSNDDYVLFLNSVASTSDPFGLYSPLMSDHFWGGISRVWASSEYRYASKAGYEDLPVTFVSFHDAVRYANWLHYGRPNTGASVLGTTEGDSNFGAYDTSLLQQASSAGGAPRRGKEANYWIPNCDEWVKAGFYDPVQRRYHSFAFGDEIVSAGSAAGLRANYYSRMGWARPFPHLSAVTDYSDDPSPFGTLNQAGNVMEWIDSPFGAYQMARGGSLFMYENALSLGYEDGELPWQKLSTFGFRVAKRTVVHEYPPPSVQARSSVGEFEARQERQIVDGQGEVFVRIAYPGNSPDPLYGKGAVAYEFEIAKLEVSNSEYAAFLNSVASIGDPYGLYHVEMGNGIVGGIERSTEGSLYRYRIRPGWENRPATYLSWFDAARFANWKHFGAPATGRSEIGTTEGDDDSGAYDTRHFPKQPGGPFDPSVLPASRNSGARYFLPNDDEWYKAAYFDPKRPGARQYHDYPTRSDKPPTAREANFQTDRMAVGPPFYLAEVTEYSDSESFFGTRQQGGNVWEWTEDWRSMGVGNCWRCDEWTKGIRGGSFNYSDRGLSAQNIDPGAPGHGYFVYGVRLARSIDEKGWVAQTNWVSTLREAVRQAAFDYRVRPEATVLLAAVGAAAGVLGSAGGLISFVVGRKWLRRMRRSARRA